MICNCGCFYYNVAITNSKEAFSNFHQDEEIWVKIPRQIETPHTINIEQFPLVVMFYWNNKSRLNQHGKVCIAEFTAVSLDNFSCKEIWTILSWVSILYLL